MAIFKHPDGTFHRYPFSPTSGNPAPPLDEYTNPDHWRQVEGARPGVQRHRDGKTMRNLPTPSTA